MEELTKDQAIELGNTINPDNIYALRVKGDKICFAAMGEAADTINGIFASSPDAFMLDRKSFYSFSSPQDVSDAITQSEPWSIPLFTYVHEGEGFPDDIIDVFGNTPKIFYLSAGELSLYLTDAADGDYVFFIREYKRVEDLCTIGTTDDEEELYAMSLEKLKKRRREEMRLSEEQIPA